MIMLLYCDKCAQEHNYGFTTTKEPGHCELCGKRAGKMNVMDSKFVRTFIEINSKKKIEIGGFEMKQIGGFVPGTAPDQLHPGMRRVVLTPDRFLFQGSNEIILASSDGKQIQITFQD
jgi:hypothetical protein